MKSNEEKNVAQHFDFNCSGMLSLSWWLAAERGSTPVGVPIPPPAGQNIVPIAVNGGPLVPLTTAATNGAFVSVNMCVPGTSTCQTIDDVLVDTGSFGLRILASQVTISPHSADRCKRRQLNDCAQFLDNSFSLGNSCPADVKMAGEVASATSVQFMVIANPAGTYSIPTSCSTPARHGHERRYPECCLGANGILGVGPEPFDCGEACDPVTVNTDGRPPVRLLLYAAPLMDATPMSVSCGAVCGDRHGESQVTNPVFNFTGDNNGVIIELPAVTDTAAIGKRKHDIRHRHAVQQRAGERICYVQLDSSDNFTTVFSGQTYSNEFH